MNMDKIMSLSLNEVCAVMKLMELAKEAEEVYRLIRESYNKIDIGEQEVIVCEEPSNYEYLSNDLVWHAWHREELLTVTCTPDVIFELFKAEYFADTRRVISDYYKKKARICKKFRSFVKRLQEEGN